MQKKVYEIGLQGRGLSLFKLIVSYDGKYVLYMPMRSNIFNAGNTCYVVRFEDSVTSLQKYLASMKKKDKDFRRNSDIEETFQYEFELDDDELDVYYDFFKSEHAHKAPFFSVCSRRNVLILAMNKTLKVIHSNM